MSEIPKPPQEKLTSTELTANVETLFKKVLKDSKVQERFKIQRESFQ